MELTAAEKTLAEKLEFAPEVLRLVKEAVGHNVEPFTDAFRDWKWEAVSAWDWFDGKGLGVLLGKQPGEWITSWDTDLIHRTRAALAPLGYLSFLIEDSNYHPCLFVLKTLDPYEIIRVEQTQGWDDTNKTYSAEDFIHLLQEWQTEFQFRANIVGAGYQHIKVELETLPQNLVTLANRLNFLCPELCDEIYGFEAYGIGTTEQDRLLDEQLAQAIQETKRIFLWWD